MKKKVIFVLLMIVSIFGTTNVKAATNNIELTNIDILDKTSTITVEEPVISNNEITSNITFNNVDDYVEFKLTLKNNESDKLKITNIRDNLDNENIAIDYIYDNSVFIESGGTTTVHVKMTYKTKLVNEDKTIDDLKITLTLEKENGEKQDSEIIVNPTTGDGILGYVFIFIAALVGFGLAVAIKNKKTKLVSVLIISGLILSLPACAFAEVKYEAFINYTNIAIKGEFEEYTVAFDTDGGTSIGSQTVKYGEKATKPDTDPEKTDHIFEGWYTDDTYGTEFDFDSAITNDTTIYAGYHHKCRTFSTDSWDTINDNVKGDTSYYGVGCEKEVEMDMDDDNIPESYTVRIANTSSPEVCLEEEFSQTACGVIIEFVDFVGIKKADSSRYESYYEGLDIWYYLNNDLYNKLPVSLQNSIIEVTTYSSAKFSEYSISNNKIYLVSLSEVGIDSIYDTGKDYTRTFDYYVNSTNDMRIKYKSSGIATRWWSRTVPHYRQAETQLGIHTNGAMFGEYANISYGIAPAFRIGNTN